MKCVILAFAAREASAFLIACVVLLVPCAKKGVTAERKTAKPKGVHASMKRENVSLIYAATVLAADRSARTVTFCRKNSKKLELEDPPFRGQG